MIFKTKDDNKILKTKIKHISIDKGITINHICNTIGILNQNYQNKFKKQYLSFVEISDILNVLNCDLEINIIDRETGKKL